MSKVYGKANGKQLVADLKAVVADAEALIKATADQSDEKLVEIRGKAEESLKVAKARMAEMQTDLALKTEKAAKATADYVHERPWQCMGIAASIGLVIGCLLRHR